MNEAAVALGVCEFCNQRSALLCDGKLPEWKTCDRKVCRSCAGQPLVSMHINRGRKGCGWDTRDLCPDCRKAGRNAF